MNSLKAKNTLILLLLVVASVTILHAQSYFGLRAGVNFANIGGAEKSGVYQKKGFEGVHSGLFFDFEVNKKWAIQPEFDFTQKGYVRWSRYIHKISYLELAVLLKYKYYDIRINEKGKKIGLYGLAGPYGSAAIYGKYRRKGDGTFKNLDLTSNEKKDLGLIAGIGSTIPTTKGQFFIDFRYMFGIYPIIEDGNKNWQYRGIIIGAGYAWKL